MYTFGDGVEKCCPPMDSTCTMYALELFFHPMFVIFRCATLKVLFCCLVRMEKAFQLFVELTVCIYALDVDVFDARVP